jgi:DNA-binding LacI/PurR family transcriptional regulator
MIYLTPSEGHDEFLAVASPDFPIILLGQVAGSEEKIPCIDINNRKTGKEAVEHLIGLGRRNILMLIPENRKHTCCMQDRMQGYCDALAMLFIESLKTMGRRIPEDIALIGFGNSPVCQHISPPLSSVQQPVKKQVHVAIDLLLKILNKEIPYEPVFHEIEPERVIRESTQKASVPLNFLSNGYIFLVPCGMVKNNIIHHN